MKSTAKSSEKSAKASTGSSQSRSQANSGDADAGSSSFHETSRGIDWTGQLLGQLPKPLQNEIKNALEQSNKSLLGAQTYVRENPKEALGLVLGLGAFALVVAGTGPGRKVAKWGFTLALPYATRWMADRLETESGDLPDGGDFDEVTAT